MDIKIFGKLVEITGTAPLSISGPEDTDALREMLFDRYPALKEMKFFISVNAKIAAENTPLTADAVVALLPPFSGG